MGLILEASEVLSTVTESDIARGVATRFWLD